MLGCSLLASAETGLSVLSASIAVPLRLPQEGDGSTQSKNQLVSKASSWPGAAPGALGLTAPEKCAEVPSIEETASILTSGAITVPVVKVSVEEMLWPPRLVATRRTWYLVE